MNNMIDVVEEFYAAFRKAVLSDPATPATLKDAEDALNKMREVVNDDPTRSNMNALALAENMYNLVYEYDNKEQ